MTTVSIASAAASPAPTVSISASPFMVTSGEQSRITWSSTNATTCLASGHWTGEKPLADSKYPRKLTSAETFILTCTGPGGSATNQVTSAGTRQSVAVSGANTTSYEISGLTAGTWYFEVAADAMEGTEGPPSSIGQLTI